MVVLPFLCRLLLLLLSEEGVMVKAGGWQPNVASPPPSVRKGKCFLSGLPWWKREAAPLKE